MYSTLRKNVMTFIKVKWICSCFMMKVFVSVAIVKQILLLNVIF